MLLWCLWGALLRAAGPDARDRRLQGQGPHHPELLLQLVVPADAAAAAEHARAWRLETRRRYASDEQTDTYAEFLRT